MIMRAIWTRLAPGIAALALALASGAANADCDFLTGGGFIIVNNGAHANFGVGGGCSKDGTPTWGHLEYIDHDIGLNVHWTSITAYFPDVLDVDAKARFICGKARTNLYGNVDFAVRAKDVAEPGVNDEFDIQLTQPQGSPVANVSVYTTNLNFLLPPHKLNDGAGGGGNIQLHGPRADGGSCPARFAFGGASKPTKPKRTLVDGVLQRLSGAELRQARRLDVERRAGARVAAGAGGALGGVEGTEAHQGHHLVLPQAGFHGADEGVERSLGGGLRNLRRLRDLLNQIGLVHGTAS